MAAEVFKKQKRRFRPRETPPSPTRLVGQGCHHALALSFPGEQNQKAVTRRHASKRWRILRRRGSASRDPQVRDLSFPSSRSHASSRLHRDDIRRRWAKAGGNDAVLDPCRSLWGSAKDRGQQSRGTKKIIFGRRLASKPPERHARVSRGLRHNSA